MTNSPERPTPPGEYECCESGCSPCVWDTYYEELNAWNAAQMAAKAEQAAETELAEEVAEDG
ncbi:oxidoreductase-like domain-containing protein [Neptuniibacter halophilus]|uniref:oxidoreductase-like domain-containing protein n=1 Tax=Neptuniibacter halophilus TaxID=651666 RepID=UPI0025739718|nr:oxidoreductase-like domain-containing protein [Neptuniibacter halophilus]